VHELTTLRYCPSISHVHLLLSLLTSDTRSLDKDAQTVRYIPRVIILWDIARLLMYEDEADENLPPGREEESVKKGTMRFKSGYVSVRFRLIGKELY
jgi:hypothetical protein